MSQPPRPPQSLPVQNGHRGALTGYIPRRARCYDLRLPQGFNDLRKGVAHCMDVVDPQIRFLRVLVVVHVLCSRTLGRVRDGVRCRTRVDDQVGRRRTVHRPVGGMQIGCTVCLEDSFDELLILDGAVVGKANHRLTRACDTSLSKHAWCQLSR